MSHFNCTTLASAGEVDKPAYRKCEDKKITLSYMTASVNRVTCC